MSRVKQDLFDEKALEGKKKGFWAKFFNAVFIFYLIAFIIFIAMFISFKIQFICVPVQGMSMQPTINPNTTVQSESDDWVYIKRRRNIKKGDIVVFYAKETQPGGERDCLIKRVIATEGDAVTICRIFDEEYNTEVYTVCLIEAEDLQDGQVSQDEVQFLDEDYTISQFDWTYNSASYSAVKNFNGINYHSKFYNNFFTSNNFEIVSDPDGRMYAVIPEGEFFFLGDNRAISDDSQTRGTDKVSSIEGVVEILIPNAQNASSPLWVQLKAVFGYYATQTGNFFSNLWIGLENFFAL